MSQSHVSQVLVKMLMTEKTTRLEADNNCVAFEVKPDASKHDVKRAVETMFNVVVADVQTSTKRKGKVHFGSVFGQRKKLKKAFVTLAEGHSIDMGLEA